MTTALPHRYVIFIDRIEDSSYPVTETGYALVHRAWQRAQVTGGEVYVVYPEAVPYRRPGRGANEVRVRAQRVESFHTAPYQHYRSQRDGYRADQHLGSRRCHREAAPRELLLNRADALIWRQETGDPARMCEALQLLELIEEHTLVYLTPKLALDPRFGSKLLPASIDARFVPHTFYTHELEPEAKLDAALAFVRETLGDPETVVVKPLHTNNGVGITLLGRDPRRSERQGRAAQDRDVLARMLSEYGDLVVQEYIPSIRAPEDVTPAELAQVPLDRRDFGEVRFLLIDGELPRRPDGSACRFARRVPAPDSLVADSGVSHPTELSAMEQAFVEYVGQQYLRWGIYFGGGDLIRTPDPARPFVFTDAARFVCGHAVVTGALNGDPYLIVDQVLDSVERRILERRSARRSAPPLQLQPGR
jgi:hypothetical protein